jgi:hypothetical protein
LKSPLGHSCRTLELPEGEIVLVVALRGSIGPHDLRDLRDRIVDACDRRHPRALVIDLGELEHEGDDLFLGALVGAVSQTGMLLQSRLVDRGAKARRLGQLFNVMRLPVLGRRVFPEPSHALQDLGVIVLS